MSRLEEFCTDNDPAPPNFIACMVEKGECSNYFLKHPEKMSSQELIILQQRKTQYY
jgi:hypothetical protein